jgi:hypothetical protein
MNAKTETASVSRPDQFAALAAQINSLATADPDTLATAIERYLLLDILEILAQPETPPETRALAMGAYFKWRKADLTRQRLALAAAKFAAAQPPPEPPAPAPPPPHEVTPEEEQLIVDKFHEIFGLKPRPGPARSATPAPPAPPAPIPIPLPDST